MEFKKNIGPFMIVVPLTTLSNWVLEFKYWAPSIKIIAYYGTHGLDLSSMAKSLEQWGIDPIIKMQVHSDTYIGVFVLIAVTNLFASIYPAIKAIKLKPAEAIRK